MFGSQKHKIILLPEVLVMVAVKCKMAAEVVAEEETGPVGKNAREIKFERQLELLSNKE